MVKRHYGFVASREGVYTSTFTLWGMGLAIALVFGQLFTWIFFKILRNWMGTPDKSPPALTKRVPPWLTGTIERLFFTTLVGANIDGFPTAMMAWLALKLASNWNHSDVEGHPDARAFAISALLAGIVSMLCALLGGLIIAGKLP